MKQIQLISFILLFSGLAWSQNPGYLGKTNVLELETVFNMPLISNSFSYFDDSWYKKQGKNLAPGKDLFDVGYRLGYMHTFKRNFGCGLEFGSDFFSINAMRQESLDMYIDQNTVSQLNGKLERLDVNSMMIMPKIEFTNEEGLLPIGLTHQLGFGFRIMHVMDKEYLSDLYEYQWSGGSVQIPQEELNSKLFDRDQNTFKGTTLYYGLKMRTPITENLLINYGMRYTINFMNGSIYEYIYSNDQYNEKYYLNENEINGMIKERRRWSFIYFGLGLSYVF